jgi:hypothetical protein
MSSFDELDKTIDFLKSKNVDYSINNAQLPIQQNQLNLG